MGSVDRYRSTAARSAIAPSPFRICRTVERRKGGTGWVGEWKMKDVERGCGGWVGSEGGEGVCKVDSGVEVGVWDGVELGGGVLGVDEEGLGCWWGRGGDQLPLLGFVGMGR